MNYRVTSYNTSVLNAMRKKDVHPFLSESASLIAKYQKINSDKSSEYLKQFKEKSRDQTALKNLNDSFQDSVLKFGKKLDDNINEYLKGRISPPSSNSILCLIEQMIFVPKENHACYEYLVDREKYKYTDEDNNNGILKRIAALNAIDVSVTSNESQINQQDGQNYCVFDNVVNSQDGTAEGIAIFFSPGIFDSLLEWNFSDNPNIVNIRTYEAGKVEILKKQLLRLTNDVTNEKTLDEKEIEKLKISIEELKNSIKKYEENIPQNLETIKKNTDGKTIHFYSEDMGKILCGDNFVKNKETFDPETGNKVKITKDLGRPFIMTAGMKGDKLIIIVAFHGPNFSKLVKTSEGEKKGAEMSTAMAEELMNLINSGIGAAISVDEKQIKDIHIIIGCDSNDVKSDFYKTFTGKPRVLKINNTTKTVYFNQIGLNKNEHATCCANCDSSFPEKLPGDCKNNELNAVNIETLVKINNTEIYSEKFIDTDNYQYYGDYIIAGSSKEDDVKNQIFERENVSYSENGENVSSSDHFAVQSDIVSTTRAGGATNRRKSLKKQRKTRRRAGGLTRLRKRRKKRST